MENEDFNKAKQELNMLLHQADAANNTMNAFQAAIAAAITDLAFNHFQKLNEMDANDIRHFGKLISQNTWSLTSLIDELHYRLRNR